MLVELLLAIWQDMWTGGKGKKVRDIGYLHRSGGRYWTWNQRHPNKDRHDAWLHPSESNDLRCKTGTQEPEPDDISLSTSVDMFSKGLNHNHPQIHWLWFPRAPTVPTSTGGPFLGFHSYQGYPHNQAPC